jgi:hypothetical protein
MPGLDRTGPLGRGPMTGRALGYCVGYASPAEYEGGATWRPGLGRGQGGPGRGLMRRRGRGAGRGFGAAPIPFPTEQALGAAPPRQASAPLPEAEPGALGGELAEIRRQIEAIQSRLAELGKGDGE